MAVLSCRFSTPNVTHVRFSLAQSKRCTYISFAAASGTLVAEHSSVEYAHYCLFSNIFVAKPFLINRIRPRMLKRKIRSQVLIPLTLTFIIITFSFVYSSYRIRMDNYERGLENQYLRVQHILKGFTTDRTKFMTSAIEFIADQKPIQDAMLTKDRKALLNQGSPILKLLFRQQQITHFYFYDKNGALVLRVYNPQETTPSALRFTKQQAMTQGKTISGLELGSNGTFTLRVVYPWKVNGELIGYIELGQEYDQILQDLKAVSLIDFAVVLDKSHLERNKWEEGMKLLGRTADWDFLPKTVLIDQTVIIPSSIFSALLTADSSQEQFGKKIEANGRTYRAKSFPMQDVAQQDVGKFVIFLDLTEVISTLRVFIVQVVSFSFILCAGLFIYSFRVLGQVDRRLLENRKQLEKELEKQAATNTQLEIEVVERRRAEENLVVLNEHLELRVFDRTKELHQLNRQMEASRSELEEAYITLQNQQTTILQQDRMACIGQLAACVAHDINNPIGFVAGNLEILKNYGKKLGGFVTILQDALRFCGTSLVLSQVEEHRSTLKVNTLLDEFDAIIDESLEGTERINRIVLNLKGFSRQDNKEARLANIHDCLESTLNIVLNKLRYKADIKKEYGNIPQLLCFPQQLNQVFMNLLINASQAIENWGEITIRTWADQCNIYIAISDTGCGIDTENLPKLFEPFYTTKDVDVGTGLGLPIVRDIVNKHHGEITVESVAKEGTVFTVRFPLGMSPQENSHL